MKSHNVFLGFYFVRWLPDHFDPMRNSFFLNLIASLMKFSTCVIMLSANKEPQLSLSNLMVLFLFIVQFFWLRFLVPCWVGEKRGDTIVFVSHLKEKSSQRTMLLFGVFTFGFSNGLNKFFSLQSMVRALVTK